MSTQRHIFIITLYMIAPKVEKKCPSTTEQIAILWPIHTMKYYSSIKGDNLIDAKMWMNFKNLLLERSL